MLLKLGAIGLLSYTTYRIAYMEKRAINKKFYILMHELNLRNKGEQVFAIHRIHSTQYGYKVIIKNPTGYSSEDLERYRSKIISCFNCSVDIEGDKAYTKLNLIYTPHHKLKYKPIKCKANEVILGYDYMQHIKVDMNVLPHLLVAGINGSGKSRFLYSILTNLISNGDVNLNFAQILKSDLDIFKGSSLLKRRTRSIEESLVLFQELNDEMERRIKVFDRLIHKRVLNIESYNNFVKNKMKYEYLVVEEFSDFMPSEADTRDVRATKQKCLALLERLIKASRSTGIFLIICLQATTCDQMPVFLRKQCNVRVTFRQSEEAASKNVIGTDEAVGLNRGEFVMIADKKYHGKSYLIDYEDIDTNIEHTLLKNKDIENTQRDNGCIVENLVIKEISAEDVEKLKNNINKRRKFVVVEDGIRRVK